MARCSPPWARPATKCRASATTERSTTLLSPRRSCNVTHVTGKTRRSIIAIVLVAAAALAGCGGVAEQDDALTGAAVLQATRDAGTARTATTLTMSIDKL